MMQIGVCFRWLGRRPLLSLLVASAGLVGGNGEAQPTKSVSMREAPMERTPLEQRVSEMVDEIHQDCDYLGANRSERREYFQQILPMRKQAARELRQAAKYSGRGTQELVREIEEALVLLPVFFPARSAVILEP